MAFRDHHVYPLLDPTRFDDDLGEGFDHVVVHEGGEGMILTDAWPCRTDGTMHPGYDACPVPVRFEDVDGERAFPAAFDIPERQPGFWR